MKPKTGIDDSSRRIVLKFYMYKLLDIGYGGIRL